MQTPPEVPSTTPSAPQKNLPINYNPNAKGVMGEFWRRQESRVNRDNEIEELDEAIGQLNRTINASSYQLLVLIREFDERAGWLKWSFTDSVTWLRWRCDIGTGTAREKLRIAHALKELPLISEAFEAGNLSYSKVRVMTRVATVENEAELIEMARKMTVLHLTEHCKQRSNAQKASTAAALAAQNSRAFRVWHDTAKGTMHFSIELPAEEGELVEKAIEKAATRLSSETGITHLVASEDEPSWAAIQADAVVDVMRGYLSESPPVVSQDSCTDSSDKYTVKSSADHHMVMIHVDEAALVDKPIMDLDDETGQKPANPDNTTSQYPIETIRRLCCDGSIAPIIENDKGEPLNVGRRVRTITTAIRRALWARDGGCVFPGCSHKRFVDAHHIKHWANGGETSLENLVLLCSSHHKLLHEGGFQINRDHAGELFFRRPDGKALPRCGDDWVDSEVVSSPLSTDVRQNSREFFDSDNALSDVDNSNRIFEPPVNYQVH